MNKEFYPFLPDFSNKRFLVTGGAGFIGSHVLDFLLETKASHVKILDNLSTGYLDNITHCKEQANFEWIEGDITDPSTCLSICHNVDVVIHLAALGSVPRSIANPLASHAANSTGFLNVLWAAKENGVSKVVYASSSSVYGNDLTLPKKEGKEGEPLSPYAFTKQSNEAYAKLFFDLYGLETIGLRFFNVFGPRQNKLGPYAAFIPLALEALDSGSSMSIFGDGSQSRDFTYVANSVWAISGAIGASKEASGRAYNIACGDSTSLLDVIAQLEEISNRKANLRFAPPRQGDIKDSLADISLAKQYLNFDSIVALRTGLEVTYKAFNL